MAPVLGIDIGGSGIKANLVDPATGQLLAERFKIETPLPSVPPAVAEVVAKVVGHFDYRGPIGCTFPAVVKGGVTLSAANVDPAWIGYPAAAALKEATGQEVVVVNDADAAGVAEVNFGAGRGRPGVIVVLTLGTGIGSAVFLEGRLLPNTEFGHLHFAGHESVEDYAAASVKDSEGLSWKQWARRLDAFLNHLHLVMAPDLIILGGGVSRRWDKWAGYLSVPVETVPAALRNEAGIVGAAVLASRALAPPPQAPG
jgi:polyphosphate glucokinase